MVTRTKDPVWDAERATWDSRDYIFCDYCGREIHMPNVEYSGDPYYAVNGESICVDCFPEYAKILWYRRNDYA